jgi:serine phosphatase RsbU (regulator of sigma subunit)/anti-sigma regulatory factor (Ser/Thr protein kinase)
VSNISSRPPSPADAGDEEPRFNDFESLTDSALGYLSLEELLSELLDRIRAGLKADTAAILLLDDERSVLVARAAKGIEEEVRQGVHVPLARGFAGKIAAEGRPIVIEDLDRFEVVNPLLRQRGIRSMLGVPLHVEGRIIGVLHVGTLQPRLFGEEDIRLLQFAADRAALAIDNAQLSEQRSVTEIMQRTLLPEALPHIPGLRFSAKYLPAGAGLRIGGDWYDVFPLPDGRIAFVIGDVVGRGVVAASVMAEVRTALRAYLLEGHDLAATMSLLNDLLVSMGRHRSATSTLFALDMEREELSAVSAGHLPSLLIDPSHESQLVAEAQSLPLGVRAGESYEARAYAFPVGSTLLLYTDGLLERRGEPLDEGFERLEVAARAAVAATDVSVADGIYLDLVKNADFEDDLALLAIESVPLGPSFDVSLEASPAVLAGLRRTLGRWLIKHGVPADERFDITVATSEAAGNAVEHAYGLHDAHFQVACSWTPHEVKVVVRDTGVWRESTSRDHSRGRGLMIMDKLMDAAEVRSGEGGTTVTLVKRLAGQASPSTYLANEGQTQ